MTQNVLFDFERLDGTDTRFDGLEGLSCEKPRIFLDQYVATHSIILSPVAQKRHNMPTHAGCLVAFLIVTKNSLVNCRSEQGIDADYAFNLICQAVNAIDGEFWLSEHLQNPRQVSARFIRGRIIGF